MEYTLASKHLQKSKPVKRQCPECGSTNLVSDFDTGEVVCNGCGLVLHEQVVDRGPEWRAFDDEQRRRRTRVGASSTYTMHDKGLSTTIDWRDRDAYGKPIPSGIKADLYRLRKWQHRTRVADHTEKSIALALAQILRLCNHLALPKYVAETASVTYQKLVKQRLVRGRARADLTASAVCFACRQCGTPRTLEEIAKAANTSKNRVGKGYRFILEELGYQLPAQRPEDYISKILNPLSISGVTEKTVYKILKAAREARLTSGKGPHAMAAGAFYVASTLTGERATQRVIADLITCTEVTIRNRYKELVENLLFDVYL